MKFAQQRCLNGKFHFFFFFFFFFLFLLSSFKCEQPAAMLTHICTSYYHSHQVEHTAAGASLPLILSLYKATVYQYQ